MYRRVYTTGEHTTCTTACFERSKDMQMLCILTVYCSTVLPCTAVPRTAARYLLHAERTAEYYKYDASEHKCATAVRSKGMCSCCTPPTVYYCTVLPCTAVPHGFTGCTACRQCCCTLLPYCRERKSTFRVVVCQVYCRCTWFYKRVRSPAPIIRTGSIPVSLRQLILRTASRVGTT